MTQWMLTSSVLILLVIAVRGLFKNRMKAKYTYALWLIVLVRLLCPVNFGELSFNLLSLAEEGKAQLEERIEERETLAQQEAKVHKEWEEQKVFFEAHGIMYIDLSNPTEMVQNPVDSSELPDSYLPMEDAAIAEQPMENENTTITKESGVSFPEINWQKVLPSAWFAGMAAMTIIIFGVNISFGTMLGMFRKELPAFTRKGRGKQDLAVYLAEGINSSCLYGVVRPSIYLNKEGMGEQEKTYCVEHEYSHYLQGDMVWSLCRTVCLILHWYNPLVWLAVMLSKKDAELACDERTIERLGEEERFAYGHTLVELAAAQSKAVQMFGMATLMASDTKEVVERVKAITTKKQTKIITGLLVAILVVGIGFFVFTGEAKGEQDNSQNDVAQTTETPAPTEEATETASDEVMEETTQDTKQTITVATAPTPMPAFVVEHSYNMNTYISFRNYVLDNNEFPVQGLVTPNKLNVRNGAGTSYDKLTILSKNTEVTILDVTKVNGEYWYEIAYGAENQTGYVRSEYIAWAGSFRLYESPEENSAYITLDYYSGILQGVADAGSEWFYIETPDYQSGWVRYGEHGGVDESIRGLLRITESEWDMVREEKSQTANLTLVEDVNYTPLSFVDHVALEQVAGEGWMVDLNGDGEQENLYINADGVYINGEKKFILSYKQTFWLLDIDTTDKMFELLTSSGDMYIYDGKEFQRVKGIREIYFAEESTGTPSTFRRYLGTLNEFTRIDEHTISFEDCFHEWAAFFAKAQYTLDENHGLQVIPGEYEIQAVGRIDCIISSDDNSYYSEAVEAKKFKLYAERNLDGEYVEVSWLTDVSLLKSDCVEWIYAETADGVSGWLHYDENAEDQFRILLTDSE